MVAACDTSIPRPVRPVLDKLSALVKSIPKDKLGQLLDESFTTFNGAGYDLEWMLDSSSRVSHDTSGVVDHTRWARRRRRPTRRGGGRTTWSASPTRW